MAGGAEPLLDDSLRAAEAARAAGVDATVLVQPYLRHAFPTLRAYVHDGAVDYEAKIAAFARRVLNLQ